MAENSAIMNLSRSPASQRFTSQTDSNGPPWQFQGEILGREGEKGEKGGREGEGRKGRRERGSGRERRGKQLGAQYALGVLSTRTFCAKRSREIFFSFHSLLFMCLQVQCMHRALRPPQLPTSCLLHASATHSTPVLGRVFILSFVCLCTSTC